MPLNHNPTQTYLLRQNFPKPQSNVAEAIAELRSFLVTLSQTTSQSSDQTIIQLLDQINQVQPPQETNNLEQQNNNQNTPATQLFNAPDQLQATQLLNNQTITNNSTLNFRQRIKEKEKEKDSCCDVFTTCHLN